MFYNLTRTASFRLHSTAPQLEWVLLRQTDGQRGPALPYQLRGGCSLPAQFLEVAAFGVCQVQGPLAVPEPHQGVLCKQPCQGGLLASTQGTSPKACGLLSPQGWARRPCPRQCPVCSPWPNCSMLSKLSSSLKKRLQTLYLKERQEEKASLLKVLGLRALTSAALFRNTLDFTSAEAMQKAPNGTFKCFLSWYCCLPQVLW